MKHTTIKLSAFFVFGALAWGSTCFTPLSASAQSIGLTVTSDACSSSHEGKIRYNSSSTLMEYCNGSSWAPIAYGSSSVETIVSQATGTTIGDMSGGGGLAAAFDGSKAGSLLAQKTNVSSGTTAFIGKNYGTAKTITRVVVTGAGGSLPFHGASDTVSITMNIEYSDDGSDWTTAETANFTNNSGNKIQDFEVSPSSAHSYWRVLMTSNQSSSSGLLIDEVEFYETETSAGSVSNVWTPSGSNAYYSSGNIGIGTDNPTSKLQVVEGDSTLSFKRDTTLPIGRMGLTSLSGVDKAAIEFDTNSTFGLGDPIDGNAHIYFDGALQLVNSASSGLDNMPMMFGTGGRNTDVLIDGEGNVGIGVTTGSPFSKLRVVGTTVIGSELATYGDLVARSLILTERPQADGFASLGFETGDTYKGSLDFRGSDGALRWWTHDGSTWTEKMAITPAGNVGIGTTSPAFPLDVQGTSHTRIQISAPNESAKALRLSTGGAARWDIVTDTTDETGSNVGSNLYFNRMDDSGAYIDSVVMLQRNTGNVGIGTTSPTTALTINDSLKSSMLLTSAWTSRRAEINHVDDATSGTAATLVVNTLGDLPSNSTASHYGMLIENSMPEDQTASYATRGGALAALRNAGSSDLTSQIGFFSNVQNLGTGTVTNNTGGQFISNNGGVGATSTNMIGVVGNVFNAGTVTTAYGLRSNFSNTGTITTGYGLYLGKGGSGGTITNNYGIYQADTGKNYFAGSIGIGIESPDGRLDVDGAARLRGSVFLDSSVLMLDKAGGNWLSVAARDTTGSEAVMNLSNLGTINATQLCDEAGSNCTDLSGGINGVSAADTLTNLGRGSDFDFNTLNDNVGGVRWVDGGGTNSNGPVNGGNTTGTLVQFNPLYAASGIENQYKMQFSNPMNGSLYWRYQSGSAWAEWQKFLTVNTGNDVGIGTASPTMAVNGSATTMHLYQNDGNGAGYRAQSSNSSLELAAANAKNFIYSDSNTPLGIFTNSTERLHIAAAGNVGIGTNDPQANLHVSTGNGVAIVESTTADVNTTLKLKNDARTWQFGVRGSDLSDSLVIRDETASEDRFTVNSSGNVGIGTTSPSTKLDVLDSVQVHGASPVFRFSDTDAGTNVKNFQIQNSNGALVFGTNNDDWSWKNSNALVLNTNGNVGVGLTGPTAKLHVLDSSYNAGAGTSVGIQTELGNVAGYFGNSQLAFGLVGQGYRHSIKSRHSGGDQANNAMDFYLWNYGTDASTDMGTKQVMSLLGNGNVGIGTTSPSTTLTVNGTLSFDNTQTFTGAGYQIGRDGANFLLLTSGDAGVRITDKATTTELLRLTSSGNLGVGTASPAAKMDVSGNFKAWADVSLNPLLNLGHTGTGSATGLVYTAPASNTYNMVELRNSANTSLFTVNSAGHLGIAGISPTVALDVNGSIEYTGTIADVSDRRLKTDIKPLIDRGSMLERIRNIDTYTFRMKDDEKGLIEYGVMAQDIEEIFPELVTTATDEMGTKTMNYVGLIAPMIEAIKELDAENKAYEDRFATIEDDIKGLKAHTGYGINQAGFGFGALLGLIFGGLLFTGLFVWRSKRTT